MHGRPLFALAVLALLAACGWGVREREGADADAGMSEAATESRTASSDEQSTAGDVSPSDASPAPASNERCAEARFEDTEPFAVREGLPFSFEVPAGWDRLDSSPGVGSVAYRGPTGRRSGVGMIQYVFGEPLSSPNVMLDMYRQSMEQIGTATIGGEGIEVFSHDCRAWSTPSSCFPTRED